MNQKIIFTNKTHGKLNMSMIDLIAWRKYTDVEELPQQPEIINLHPQADQIAEPKKGRGRPKKLPVVPEIIPEPELEPIHQHPEPEVKRKVGRPRKIIQQVIQYSVSIRNCIW